MGLLNSFKNAVLGGNLQDELYYEIVALELGQGMIRPGLWAKALSDSSYDEQKAKARYIKLRVKALKAAHELNKQDSASAQQDHPPLKESSEASTNNLAAEAIENHQGRDYAKAFQEVSNLAEANIPWAQNYVAYMYELGQGVEANMELAISWYRRAADRNDRDAQYRLGYIYLNLYQRYDEALGWLRKAESNGHPDAFIARMKTEEFIQSRACQNFCV